MTANENVKKFAEHPILDVVFSCLEIVEDTPTLSPENAKKIVAALLAIPNEDERKVAIKTIVLLARHFELDRGWPEIAGQLIDVCRAVIQQLGLSMDLNRDAVAKEGAYQKSAAQQLGNTSPFGRKEAAGEIPAPRCRQYGRVPPGDQKR